MKQFVVIFALIGACLGMDSVMSSAEAQFLPAPGMGGVFFGPRPRAVPIGPQPSYRVVRRTRYAAPRRYRKARTYQASQRSRGYARGGGYYSAPSYSQRPVGLQPGYVPCIGGSETANGMRVCY